MEKKVVRVKESELIALIEGILGKAVNAKKKEWIAESAKSEKMVMLENKIAKLEKVVSKLTSK
jgi:hypothetical protein